MKTIQEWRADRGMTQAQLAAKLGVTSATVYNWERGKSEPRASQLRRISEVLSVSMDDIDVPETESVQRKTRHLNVSGDG